MSDLGDFFDPTPNVSQAIRVGLDPADLSGQRAGGQAEDAAKKAAREQEEAGLAGVEEIRRQFDITTGQLTEAEKANREALLRGQEQFGAQVSPFAQAGVGALQQQQALLGMGGPEAQAAARAMLTESPGQQFIRERQEKALLRNAAAIGGLGGGNVRTALQQQAAGQAAQIEADQFRRLQDLTQGGQIAAQNIGQAALGTAGQIGSGAINTAARQGQFGQQAAANIAGGLGQAAQARASGILGAQQAKAQQQQQLLQTGATAAQLFFSDERLKEDIELIASDKNGNIYNFKYLGSPVVYKGRIAQELQEIRPDAVIPHESGYLQVTEEFKPEVIRWH